jgi:hypothetical protein
MSKNKWYIFLGLIGWIVSCDDIIVKNISGDIVVLNSPGDSIKTKNANQTFSWSEVQGATGYELVIESTNALTLDTVITKNRFSTVLTSGEYKWCVRATNGGYYTSTSCRMFEILPEEIEDISKSTVVLRGPADNIQTTNKQNLFLWDEVEGASKYHVLIVTPDFQSPTKPVLDTTIVKTSLVRQLLVGKYEWCVQGINAEFKTELSCRKLEITN